MLDRHWARVIAAATLLCACNRPPDTPDPMVGPSVGSIDSCYYFKASVFDPDPGKEIELQVDWGDGDVTAWLVAPSDGYPFTVSHNWSAAGDYALRVRCRDFQGATTVWSDSSPFHAAPRFPGRLVAARDLGDEMLDCVVLPGADKAYASSRDHAQILLLDLATCWPDLRLPVGDPGFEPGIRFALAPDAQSCYAACFHLGKVLVLRTSDHAVVDSILLDHEPVGVAVHPGGEFAYVLQWSDSNQLVVVSTADNSVQAEVTVGRRPCRSCAFTPDGEHAYLTSEDEDVAWVIRTSDHAVVDSVRVPREPRDVGVTSNGRYAFVLSTWNHGILSRIRTSDNALLDSVVLGDAALGLTLSPDGEYAYTTGTNRDAGIWLWVVRTADGALVDTIFAAPGEVDAPGVAASPDGRKVLVTTREGWMSVFGW